jgi:hypothetical protein
METPNTLRNASFIVLIVWILWIPLRVCSGQHRPTVYDPKAMRERYESWVEKHGRRYKNKEEWELRFGIYQSNVQFIHYINSQNLSFKVTDNIFADMTNAEFKATYLGFRNKSHPKTNFSYDKNETLPISVDWRKKGAVTPVKNQGQCGRKSCFSRTKFELLNIIYCQNFTIVFFFFLTFEINIC